MRSQLGTLSGIGVLRTRGNESGSAVRYRLDVFVTRGAKTGSGMFAGDMNPLMKARESGDALELVLSDGAVVAIVVSHSDTDGAQFQVSGPVPGF